MFSFIHSRSIMSSWHDMPQRAAIRGYTVWRFESVKGIFYVQHNFRHFFYKFPWISLSTNLTYWRLSVPVIIYPLGLSSLSLSQHQMRKFSMTARREADEFYLSVRRMASVWGRASSEVYDRQSHFLEVWGRKPPKVEYVYWYLFCLHFCT